MDYIHAHKHKLHRRQRGPPALGEDIPGITTATLASPIAALPTTAATGPGRGRGPTSDEADTPIRAGPGREPEDADEDGDESTGMLSSCSISCLNAQLGAECRTVSCMCNSPLLPNASTCISVACPARDRRTFLANIRSWCGPAQASALVNAVPVAITSSSTSPGRGRTTVGSAQATSLTATDSVISSGSALSTATSLDDLSEAASSTSDTTTRSAFTRTTTSLAAAASDVDGVSSATSASRPVNPKIGNNGLAINGTDSDINSDSSNQDANNNDVNGAKKGLSTGAVVGVAIGLILAFALVGLLVWYIRKYLIARQKDKELLRSSDNAGGGNGDDDWINDTIGGGGEKNENDRIERSMSERMGGDSSMNLAGVIQPGIGAYARNTLQSQHSEGSNGGIGAPNQHYSIMSQKQYEDINAALAYPSHMGISPVPAPYNTHHSQHQFQGYPQQHPQGGYIHPFAQQQMQQQQQQQYQSQVQPHARDSLPALPPVAFYQTPRNSLNSIQAPSSIGGDSGRAAHLSHSGTMDSPYPESITMTPDTTSNNVMGGPAGMNHAGVPNASINPSDLTASQLGKYQSIPFIIPAQTQHQSIIAVGGASESGAGSNRDSQQTARQSRRMSSLPVARSLTAGQGDLSSSSSQSTVAGQGSARDSKQLRMAQGIPLPMSPPQRQASLPMPLPGFDHKQTSAIPGVAQQPTLPTENITQEQEIVKKVEEDQQQNPFEDGAKEEKSRTSFEGLAYLAR